MNSMNIKLITMNQESNHNIEPNSSVPNPSQTGQSNYDYLQYDPYYYRVGFGLRFLAFLIDAVFGFILVSFIMNLTDFDKTMVTLQRMMEEIQKNPDSAAKFTSYLESDVFKYYSMSFAVSLVYYITELTFGWSLGKFIMRIRIGSDSNSTASTAGLMFRYLSKHSVTIVFLFVFLFAGFSLMIVPVILTLAYIIGCFFIFGMQKQTLYDKLSKTAVYRVKELRYLEEYSRLNSKS